MKLDEVNEEWEKDAKIDPTNLGYESIQNPILHSKYLTKLSHVRLLVRKSESDYLTMRKDKYRYFRGELTRDELKEHGWQQYQGRVPLKSEMDEFLSTDADMIRLTNKLEYLKTIQYTLEQIMKAISSRGWEIKAAIEWEKLRNGVV
jgi:hypothetical protein